MVPFSAVSRRPFAFVALLLAACAVPPQRTQTPSAAPGVVTHGSEPAAHGDGSASAVPETALDDSGESEHEGDDERLDDGEIAEPAPGAPVPHPLDGWSEERIEHAVTTDLPSLGSMSVGTPNAGGLVNGVQAVASPLYSLVSPGSAWGTQETIDYLNAAVQAVHDQFPDTPPLSLGEDPEWLAQIFQGKGAVRAIIRHAPGHATHLHLRFWNPRAQETARRCYASLARHQLVRAPMQFTTHKVKKNETLAMIAKKYGSTVRAIREANGLRSNLIHEQAVYRIPLSSAGGVRIPHTERVRIPARRPPPARRDVSAASSSLS